MIDYDVLRRCCGAGCRSTSATADCRCCKTAGTWSPSVACRHDPSSRPPPPASEVPCRTAATGDLATCTIPRPRRRTSRCLVSCFPVAQSGNTIFSSDGGRVGGYAVVITTIGLRFDWTAVWLPLDCNSTALGHTLRKPSCNLARSHRQLRYFSCIGSW